VVDSAGSAALPGAGRLVRFGGEGTPATCEFCPAELGAEMGMSPEAAAMLLGDALDLRHRLPMAVPEAAGAVRLPTCDGKRTLDPSPRRTSSDM